MKSTKCGACGFVGWSDENCKACGASLTTTQYNHWDQQQGQKKGLAIFALLLGIAGFFTLGLFLVGSIVGIVVAVKAMGKVKSEPWQYGGRSIAIAGLVLNILAITNIVPVALIASIAIPNLFASIRAANEASAINSLQEISMAQATYHSNFDKYGTLEELAAQSLIDRKLSSGNKNGYNFTVELTTDEMNVQGFAAVGTPETYRNSGIRSFYIDETSIIRAGDNYGGPSTKMDEPLDLNSDYPRRARRFDERPQTVY